MPLTTRNHSSSGLVGREQPYNLLATGTRYPVLMMMTLGLVGVHIRCTAAKSTAKDGIIPVCGQQ